MIMIWGFSNRMCDTAINCIFDLITFSASSINFKVFVGIYFAETGLTTFNFIKYFFF